MIFTIYFIYALLFTVHGVTNQVCYSLNGSKWSEKFDEHGLFNIERIFWGIVLISGMFYILYVNPRDRELIDRILFVLPKVVCLLAGSFFSFSFFHNGGYGIAYYFQHSKKVLLKGWFHTSSTDTSKISFDFMSRFWLFVFGLVWIFIGEFIIK